MYHVFFGSEEHWFTSREQLESFVTSKEEVTGGELEAGKADENKPGGGGAADPETAEQQLIVIDLHEVRSINAGLTELDSMGFGIESLMPEDRTGTEEPRYLLRRGEHKVGIEDLRGLLTAVRRAGEKGLSITRFKGLGEMTAEELRETTLDPANRTLHRVTMDDAAAADDLFRVLMGEKVEPRRKFIERNALDVRNLDV
jgi:DNA gyrase subunit B